MTFTEATQTNITAYRQIAREYAATHTLEKIPPFWQEHLAYFTTLTQPLTQQQPELPIVELGCGPGRDALLLAQRGFTVLATDISEAMLAEARQTIQGQAAAERITLRQMDMRALDLPADSCAGLWISASFLHIPKTGNRTVLRECARVLIPHGIMTLLVKASDQGEDERYDVSVNSGVRRFFARYSGPELWTLLEDCGFTIWSMRLADDERGNSWLAAIAIKRPA